MLDVLKREASTVAEGKSPISPDVMGVWICQTMAATGSSR